MSWVKRNLYFVISCVIAVVLLGAAGWYCYTQWQGDNQAWDQISQAFDQLKQFAQKPITPDAQNIETARVQTVEIRDLDGKLRKFVTPIAPIPETTNVDDRALTFAMRQSVADLRSTAVKFNVALDQPDFAFSFTAQLPKAVYVASSRDQLARQLGEVTAICDLLFSNRINSLVAIQRERTADDTGGTAPDYVDSISVTNNGTIITPYSITFRAFDEQLGRLIASFANEPHGMLVRSMEIEPADMAAAMETPQPPPTVTPGARPVIVDEKRLKITMLLDLVKFVPTQGR